MSCSYLNVKQVGPLYPPKNGLHLASFDIISIILFLFLVILLLTQVFFSEQIWPPYIG